MTTLKLNVRTVLVDVVVTDKSGHAVPGLTKGDFQVSEDGKPQTISFFEPNFSTAPDATAAAPPALPPNTFTNVPTVVPNDSVNVLLMDALNTAEGDQSYVHKEMVRYLATLPPRIRIAVFMLSEKLRIIQGFTQDGTVLRAAINRLAANPNTSALLPTVESTNASQSAVNMILQEANDNSYGGVPNASLAATASALQQFQGQEAGFERNQRVMMTLEAFQQIAKYLTGVPGRKNLIWFVGDFPHCLAAMVNEGMLSNGGCPYDEQFKKTVDMLAEARVSVYPVDARGLTTHTLYTAENPNLTGQPNSFQAVIQSQTSSLNADLQQNGLNMADMDILATATGGKARYGGNDFKGYLTADIENGSRFYTLAYTPSDRKEVGKERQIAVKTVSGDYKLSYRRSYYEDTPKEQKLAESAPATDPLRPMMDRGMPDFTELRYRVKITPTVNPPTDAAAHAGDNTDLKPPFIRYTIGFTLATDRLTLVPDANGVRRGNIEVALVAYSQAGKPLNWEARSIGLAVRPEQNEMAQKSGIPFHFDIDAPPGDVYLRTGIYDLSSSRAGTLEIPMTSVTVAAK
ncbi:MAG: VWA domain-containing protein [Terracidiphilus sp.]|jgi:VWFA-related protein